MAHKKGFSAKNKTCRVSLSNLKDTHCHTQKRRFYMSIKCVEKMQNAEINSWQWV